METHSEGVKMKAHKKDSTNLLLLGLVVLLVVISGAQTLQINGLEDKIESGELATGKAAGTISPQVPTARPVAQPSMVGGC